MANNANGDGSKQKPYTKNRTTKAPTGLVIGRNGDIYTAYWKINDADYGDGQTLQFRTQRGGKWGGWSKEIHPKPTATSWPITIKKAGLLPKKKVASFDALQVRVRGKRKTYSEKKKSKTIYYSPQVSGWATTTFKIDSLKKPLISASWNSDNENVTVFSWAVDPAPTNSDHAVFTDTIFQTAWVKGSNLPGNKVSGWNPAVSRGASSYYSTPETIPTLSPTSLSYTRHVRVKARGPKGETAWVYAKHVYAFPCKPRITKAEVCKSNKSSGLVGSVQWSLDQPAMRPVDSVEVQYSIAVMGSSRSYPVESNWTTAHTLRDTKGINAAGFTIDNDVGDDESVYVRVNAKHDNNITYGDAVRIGPSHTHLAPPSDLSVSQVDETTYKATVNATNNSQVPSSKLLIYFRAFKTANRQKYETIPIAVMDHNTTSIQVQCPNVSQLHSYAFGVRAFEAASSNIKYQTISNGGVSYRKYTISNAIWSTSIIWSGGDVPKAPTNVTVFPNDNGSVGVTWNWAWSTADYAELSWSDHDDAWESTDEPSTYRIAATHIGRWNIHALDYGVIWYIRVRLIQANPDGTETIGPWSATASINLTSEPNKPSLDLSAYVATLDQNVKATWTYSTNDNSEQKSAVIALATVNNGEVTIGGTIASVNTAQNASINPKSLNWSVGTTYNLCVKVWSQSGTASDWSDPVSITIAEPLQCNITQTSLISRTAFSPTSDDEPVDGTSYYIPVEVESPVSSDIGAYYEFDSGEYVETADTEIDSEKTYYTISIVDEPSEPSMDSYYEKLVYDCLDRMPFTVTVTGAGSNGTTIAYIVRSETYRLDRPDEDEFNGYEGETISQKTQNGESQIVFNVKTETNAGDLIGTLDDGARYRLVAVVSDNLGQTATAYKDFTVHWEHQAVMPIVDVLLDDSFISIITTPKPVGWSEGDVCDIYRLSVDKPELIIQNGSFDETYVDPYPALGEHSGYRVVFKTINGDYITKENTFAWVDWKEEIFDTPYNLFDFDSGQVSLLYNLDLSNSWKKDFKETKYLGGHIQGDWNPGVSRTGSVNTVSVIGMDDDTIQSMRRLAEHSGICHVRTRDGSSYAADIQVSENLNHDQWDLISYTLNITRVDSEGLDGMTLEEWERLHPTEEPQEG